MGYIEVLILILYCVGLMYILVGYGCYFVEYIVGFCLVELFGIDILYWVGDIGLMFDEIEEFIIGVCGGVDVECMFVIIMFIDIVGLI